MSLSPRKISLITLAFSCLFLLYTLVGVVGANASEDTATITLISRGETAQKAASTLPTTGPNLYSQVLAMAQSPDCALPEEARIFYLALIRTESNFQHYQADGKVIVNEIGAVGISQLFTDILGREDAPYHYSAEIASLAGNLLQGCKHFRFDWEQAESDPRLAIARYKGFRHDPHHSYVSEALCFASTLLAGPCLRD